MYYPLKFLGRFQNGRSIFDHPPIFLKIFMIQLLKYQEKCVTLNEISYKTQDQFETIAKIGTGLTDEGWREMKKRCDEIKVTDKPMNVVCAKDLEPDVWVRGQIQYVLSLLMKLRALLFIRQVKWMSSSVMRCAFHEFQNTALIKVLPMQQLIKRLESFMVCSIRSNYKLFF